MTTLISSHILQLEQVAKCQHTRSIRLINGRQNVLQFPEKFTHVHKKILLAVDVKFAFTSILLSNNSSIPANYALVQQHVANLNSPFSLKDLMVLQPISEIHHILISTSYIYPCQNGTQPDKQKHTMQKN